MTRTSSRSSLASRSTRPSARSRCCEASTSTYARGETLVILGGSGSGKSVLLKHMNGLLRPDRGEVLVDG